MEEELFEKTKQENKIYEGRILTLYRDDIILPDGKEGFRELIRHKGAVCVVPVTENGEFILVRQYRYAVGRMMTEIPAGKYDFVGEDPLAAAKRELREETGATAKKWTYLGVYYGSPAIVDEKIEMFMAEDLSFGETDFDDDEFIRVLKVPEKEAVRSVLAGEIPDGKTQAAILRAHLMMTEENK